MIPWKRLLGFGSLPLLAAIAPLLVIPSLTLELGARGWAAIAIGQSLGTFGLTITAGGWYTVGGRFMAGTELGEGDAYRVSLLSRLVQFVVAQVVCAPVAFFLAPDGHQVAAALMVPAMTVWGLSPTWLYVLRGDVVRIALSDTGAKLGAAVVAVIGLHALSADWVYPAALGGIGLVSVTVFGWTIARTGTAWHLRQAVEHVTGHANLTASRVAGSAFTSLATPLVALIAPSAVATFAAADRLKVLGATGMTAISAALQGWIYQDKEIKPQRQRAAFIVMNTFAALVFLGFVVIGPLIDGFLFNDAAELTLGTVVPQALALALIGLGGSVTFLYLAPAGRLRRISFASYAGSITGVAAISLLAGVDGAVGASWGVFLSEAVVVAVLVGRVPGRFRSAEHAPSARGTT